MIIKGKEEWESFGFNASISWKKTQILGLVDISKHMKLKKKLIRFILIRILSTILLPLISHCYFDWALILLFPLIPLLVPFLYMLKLWFFTLQILQTCF